MWNVKTKVIPVIIGVTGDYFKVIQKIREQHTRKTCSQGTTDNSHIGHCTHTSESTCIKYNRFNTETNDISTMNSNNRIAATLYSLGTQFVSGT